MSFEIVLEQCLWHPEKYLGTPCRRCLEIILPSICPCLGTEAHPSTATESMTVVFVLRRLLTDLVLQVLGDLCFVRVISQRVSIFLTCDRRHEGGLVAMLVSPRKHSRGECLKSRSSSLKLERKTLRARKTDSPQHRTTHCKNIFFEKKHSKTCSHHQVVPVQISHHTPVSLPVAAHL